MLGAFHWFAHMGHLFVAASGVTPTDSYITEDALQSYVAEDGVTVYVTEA